ncbi:MAG: protein kinase, partial [Chloroflexota bacterium]
MLDSYVQAIGNRYQVLDKLGEGGMGAVYRVIDRLTGQIVALKQVTLKHTQTNEPTSDLRHALTQEFTVLASLRHPHIISVLDYGFAQNAQPYFTLEFLENAQSLVAYGQHKPIEEQVKLLIQMLQALAYLHQRGI